MSDNFYTFFKKHKNKILLSGYENGVKFNKQVHNKPYLFVDSDKDNKKYVNMAGKPVRRIDFESTYEARTFSREYQDIENFEVYGSTYFEYVWINDNYSNLKSDNSKIKIGNYDIETDSEGGYGNIETADKAVISISIGLVGHKDIYCLGLKDYDPSKSERLKKEIPNKNVIYTKCNSEEALLRKFISIWVALEMDCITGWNVNGYDNLYVIRRIRRILGDEKAKKLSPFGLINESFYEAWGKTQSRFDIVGIPTLDYIECYKKFSFKNHESYKLDYIAHDVLDKKKLDYSQYRTLARLYKENSDLFYDYNIIDIVRVEDLEHKLKFIDLIFQLAHFTRTNVLDAFSTVKPCDVIIHNTLMRDNIVIPHQQETGEVAEGAKNIVGGYVKKVITGHHKYVMSFDFASLYPHLIMLYNISAETFMGKLSQYDSVNTPDLVIKGEFDQFYDKLIKDNMTMTPKGTVFSRDKPGVFGVVMKELFSKRTEYKNEMMKYKKKKEKILIEIEKRGLKHHLLS